MKTSTQNQFSIIYNFIVLLLSTPLFIISCTICVLNDITMNIKLGSIWTDYEQKYSPDKACNVIRLNI